MAEDGQVGRRASEAEPALADLMDPVALEARLKDARARRAEALARRDAHPDARRDAHPERLGAGGQAVGAGPAVPFGAPRGVAGPQSASVQVARRWSAGPKAARLRPVLVTPVRMPVRPEAAPAGKHPAPAARALPGATNAARPGRRLRVPPAVILFIAGLGLGAAGVAVAIRPAANESAGGSTGPRVAEAPAAVAAPPVAPTPNAAPAAPTTPVKLASAAPATAPAGLAVPASEPVPPRMTAPGPIGDLIGSTAAPDPAAAKTAAAAADTLPGRVSIHYPGTAQALATAARDALRAAGVADVETMPVGFAIDRSNVRYYHDADRAGAEGASALLAAKLDDAPETRDFTDYSTPAAPGRIELWLAGEPVRATVPRSPRTETAAAPAPAPSADPFSPLAPADQVREVERILIDRLRGVTP